MSCTLRVYVCSVQREKFGRKREEMADRWRKLYNLELHNLTLHNIFLIITTKRMKSMCVAHLLT